MQLRLLEGLPGHYWLMWMRHWLPASLFVHLEVDSPQFHHYLLQFFLGWSAAEETWGRGWMTKASGVGERRKGKGELRRDCHNRVAALFVPTRMQQWYIDIWYITMIYMGEGAGGGPFAGKITWCPWGAPEYVLKQEDSSELTLAFVIMTIIANNDKM